MSKLALLGGTPLCSAKPAAPWPEFDEREKRYVMEAVEARGWGGFPEPMPLAGRFAERFAAAHDARHGICAVNGSVTLEIALTALGIKAGDEVIVPTYTWIATAAAPVHVNAVPVLVDVEEKSYCIDPDAVEANITPRTRGVICVHLGASMSDLDRLTEICRRHGLFLIEDCAHMHGARWRDKGSGSWGEIGSFSFQTTKLMTSGEGGAVITSDDDLAQRCHSIVNCGRKEEGYGSFEGWLLGINGRITELQAAVLLAQLERLEENTAKRDIAATYLEEQLAPLGLRAMAKDPRVTRRGAYELILRYDKEAFCGVPRDRFIEALAAEGVEMDGDFYVPLPESPLFNARSECWPMLKERYGDGIRAKDTLERFSFPVASRAAYEEALWLHHSYLLAGREDLELVVAAVAKVKEHASELLG